MSAVTCSVVDGMLAAYVLAALEDDEAASVNLHLTECDRHLSSIGALTRASSRLGLLVEAREPRAELRDRIIEAVRAETTESSVSLGWSEERLALGSHACVFHSDDAGLKGTMAFLRAGLDRPGEFGMVFADHKRFASLAAWLQDGYMGSVSALVETGKLAMIPGAPTSDELIAGIGQRLDRAINEGYKLIRLLGFIGWDRPGWPDTASIIQFEQRVNQVVRDYPIAVVCTYDVSRLGGLSLMDGGLRNHPIAIIGERVVRENPFYLAA